MSGGGYVLVGSGLAILAAALTALVVVINQRLGDLGADLRELRGDLNTGLRDLRGELTTGLGDMRGELGGLRGELRADRERADRRHEELLARLGAFEQARG